MDNLKQAFIMYGNLSILRDIINFDNHYCMDGMRLTREECIECFDQYTFSQIEFRRIHHGTYETVQHHQRHCLQ